MAYSFAYSVDNFCGDSLNRNSAIEFEVELSKETVIASLFTNSCKSKSGFFQTC